MIIKRKSIVFVTLGSLGDIYPYIAIARVLSKLGHEITIATLSRHKDLVESSGFSFSEAQSDSRFGCSDDPLQRALVEPDRAFQILAQEFIMGRLSEAIAASVPLVMKSDLTILHPAALGARLVAEKLRRPWLSTVLSPSNLPSRLTPPRQFLPRALRQASADERLAFFQGLGQPWHAHRRRLGLPELAVSRAAEGPNGILALFSPHFARDPGDWPINVQVTGFCRYDGTADASEVARLTTFLAAGPAPMVATLGTHSVAVARHFFPAAAAAARTLGLRLLVIGGTAEALGLQPTVDTACFAAMPFSLVFRHAAVVAAHAGIGTTAQVLAAGVPFLALAFPFYDGPDNADRIRRLGAGEYLVLHQGDLRQPIIERLKSLREPRYSIAARKISLALAEENGAEAAADKIDRMLRV